MSNIKVTRVLEELPSLLSQARKKITSDALIFESDWAALNEVFHGQGAEESQGIVFQIQSWLIDYAGASERIENNLNETINKLTDQGSTD
jgi:hypothetical protein